jgi:hypothetical protein
MLSKPARKENCAVGMMPPIIPSSPWSVSAVAALDGYRLSVEFLDGTKGTVDLTDFINSETAGVFASLRNPGLFGQVYVDYGAVSWPGEIDLAADAMYDLIKAKGEWRVHPAKSLSPQTPA